MTNQPIDEIRSAIELVTGPGRAQGTGWRLRCPAHSDRDPSLSLGENDEHHALIYCQAGCDTDAVLTAINKTRRDLYPHDPNQRTADPIVATYRYTDEHGTLLYEVLRTAAKQFRQRRPDPDRPDRWLYNLQGVRRVLYRLPLVLEAVRNSQTIYLVEGEKDVHSLEARGQVATCNPGGASAGKTSKWRPEYTQVLQGAHVVIIADRDPPGLSHARAVAGQLAPHVASLTLVQPAAGKDITDHLNSGLELDAVDFLGPEIPDGSSEADGGQPEPVDGANGPSSPNPDEAPLIRLRLTPASSFQMRPVRWVWQDRMPLGEICLIPGREGVGKSTFLAWLAAQITRGNLPGIYYEQPRAVLYAASEDAWDYTVAPRMFAAGADLTMVYRVDVVDLDGVSGRLTLPTHSQLIPDAAEEVKAAILMCDPILSNIADRINPNHARELRAALEPLRDAAEKAGIAVAALAHFNKSRDVDVSTMISGSRAWVEVARANIAIARDEREDENGQTYYVQVMTQTKNNLGRLDLPSLEYRVANHEFTLDNGEQIRVGRLAWEDGVSLTSAEEVLHRRPASVSDSRTPNGRSKADLVLDVLDEHEHALSPREITDKLGGQVSYENVKKLLVRLAAAERVDRVGTGLYKAKTAVVPVDASKIATEAAGTDARASRDPLGSVPVSPTQVRGGEREGQRVDLSLRGRDNVVGGDIVPVGVPAGILTSCRICHGPLEDVDGTGVHPICEVQ